MAERRAQKPKPGSRSPLGLPRISDMIDVSDEMIAFVEKYQQVWQHESRAMIALGEFLGARADSLQAQVELMRMGSDAARRYTSWADALLGFRPDAVVQTWMQSMRGRPRSDGDDAK